MCIIFVYLSRARPKTPWKLILAGNRDENYDRPSKMAHIWPSDPNILAGRDEESGGTWLGLNKKTGRLAAITNILGGTTRDPNDPKISRGVLTNTFLHSESTLKGTVYCNNLYQDFGIVTTKYNKFNLITLDLFEKFPLLSYFTNAAHSPPVTLDATESDIWFGVSNSILRRPFKKVTDGTKEFKSIITEGHRSGSEGLVDKLLEFLGSKTSHWPDNQLDSQSNSKIESSLKNFSSISVDIPILNYGTRTHTVILVDWTNKVDFHEWTLEKSKTGSSYYSTWHHSHFNFPMHPAAATVPKR